MLTYCLKSFYPKSNYIPALNMLRLVYNMVLHTNVCWTCSPWIQENPGWCWRSYIGYWVGVFFFIGKSVSVYIFYFCFCLLFLGNKRSTLWENLLSITMWNTHTHTNGARPSCPFSILVTAASHSWIKNSLSVCFITLKQNLLVFCTLMGLSTISVHGHIYS